MTLVRTHELIPGDSHDAGDQVYNGLDAMLTLEVHEELDRITNAAPNVTYDFERALQAPILEMMLRGFKINEGERQRAVAVLRTGMSEVYSALQQLAYAVWSRELNPNSHHQLKAFFYGAMGLPEEWRSKKGVRALSMDRETLEKLDAYFYARPIIACILSFRDLSKMCQVVETQIDPDGRWRTSYNIGGTETGRLSSSKSSTGTGSNTQNLKRDDEEGLLNGIPSVRRMFEADRGWKLCNIDLEQTESFDVGWQHGTILADWTYLDALERGDIHTQVARMVWPDEPWTGDLKRDRELADRTFYRNYSFRDMAKRGGHLCLTADHEVLTRNGWVPIHLRPKEIMVWSEEKSFFEKVKQWTDDDYHGPLVHLKGTAVDLLCTPNHRIPFYKDQKALQPKLHVATADTLKRGYIPLGDKYEGGDFSVSPEIARLIAAFQSDGWQKSTNRVEFHFHKDRKFMRLEMLAMNANVPFEKRGDKAFLHASGWPKKAGCAMLNWSKEALSAFVDEYKHWDGHIGPTAISLCSTDKMQLEWLQTFGRLVGIGGNIQKPQRGFNDTLLYRLQQNNRKFAHIENMQIRQTEIVETEVYCPTVSTGFFYVRRNGKICVTGNSNYMGTAWTMARSLKIPMRLAQNFQDAYATGASAAFPAFPKWWRYVAQELQTTQRLVTPYGRERQFFGRPRDDTTLREAIAYVPQSSTADRMNLGLWRIWKELGRDVQLLAQVHDSVVFQYRESDDEDGIIQRALALTRVPLSNGVRSMTVGAEAKIGWNWGNVVKDKAGNVTGNPDGLIKWKPQAQDERTRTNGRSGS